MYPTTRQMKRKKLISALLSILTIVFMVTALLLAFNQNLWSIVLIVVAAVLHVTNRVYRYGTLYP